MSTVTTGSLGANQTITLNEWTTVLFTVCSSNGAKPGFLNTSTGIYTVPQSGMYRMYMQVTWQASSLPLSLRIIRNGSYQIPLCVSTLVVDVGTGSYQSQIIEYVFPLLAGDTVSFQCLCGENRTIYAVLDPASSPSQLGVATFSYVELIC